MSSFFDAMRQALAVVESHVGSHESPDGRILCILGALGDSVDDLHALDHEMQGAINRHSALIESRVQLIDALRGWDR